MTKVRVELLSEYQQGPEIVIYRRSLRGEQVIARINGQSRPRSIVVEVSDAIDIVIGETYPPTGREILRDE